jgi:N-acetylmuramoyl-L-alanine amidase
VLLVTAYAAAAEVSAISFTWSSTQEPRTAQATPVEVGGVAYVSLPLLTKGLGGGCRVLSERIQVDLAGHTAWLEYDTEHVNASLGQFSLAHPILPRDGDAWVAVEDVAALFDKAFRVTLEPRASAPLVAEDLPAPAQPVGLPVASGPERIEVLIVDSGHGGADAGAKGEHGLKEKDITLSVAGLLKKEMEGSSGLKVLLTRTRDKAMTASERAAFANRNGGDVFISLHAGASYAPAARGFEVFHPGEEDMPGDLAARNRALAEAVARGLAQETDAHSRGIHKTRCRVLRDLAMPALLVEIGFLTNDEERTLLEKEEYKQKIARGIAAGIRDFAATNQPTGGAP